MSKKTAQKPVIKKPWNKKQILRVSWAIICVIMILSMVMFTILPGLGASSI